MNNDNIQTGTRQRLLEAACSVFTEKGYEKTTIAEICKKAGANIASVNYHFRNKEELYSEVWRYAHKLSIGAHPVDEGVSPDSPAEERLYAFILAMLKRILSQDETSMFMQLMVKQMAEPNATLHTMIDQAVIPNAMQLSEIIRDLLGDQATEQQVVMCRLSVASQYVIFCFNQPVRKRLFGRETLDEHEVEGLAKHITSFCIAGMENIRKNEN
jgi:AcrR family transcriptional regulator